MVGSQGTDCSNPYQGTDCSNPYQGTDCSNPYCVAGAESPSPPETLTSHRILTDPLASHRILGEPLECTVFKKVGGVTSLAGGFDSHAPSPRVSPSGQGSEPWPSRP